MFSSTVQQVRGTASRCMPAVIAFASAVALASCEIQPIPDESASQIPVPDFTLGTENTHNRWSATIPPQLTVPSGAVVEVWTKEASDGQITESTVVDDLANVDFGLIHALTGPIYVEGASPGDLLAVTVHDVQVEGWGWATILPGFGFLADEFTEPWIRGFPMESGATEVAFNENITIPPGPVRGRDGRRSRHRFHARDHSPAGQRRQHGQPAHEGRRYRVLPGSGGGRALLGR